MADRDVVNGGARAGGWGGVTVAWIVVVVPLLWGVLLTLKKAALLFR
ncbi:MAG TPA: hypothetical protein VFW66_00120 [Gemmatimonadales bacterium]|nr:hypothetical protein [Gemmatimonadales bacterium]